MRISSLDKHAVAFPMMTSIVATPAAQPDYWLASFPDLTHTRLRAIRVGGRAIHRPNWNKLHREMVDRFLQSRPSVELFRLNLKEIRFHKKTDQGFIYNKSKDVSVRVCSANQAAANIAQMAEVLGLTLSVSFIHPRDRSRLESLILN